MPAFDSHCAELDLHQLERYAAARLIEPRAVERLAHSIDQHGQVTPCIGVTEGERVVLVDGYRRVAALKRLARDRALVERWSCTVAEGLIGVLCRSQSRAFAAIEEALLIGELIDGFGLTQNELARRCGRDVSWVCRRLQLRSGLPEGVLSAVREGTLSTWAATRVLAPLARANAEHAERLLQSMRAQPLGTRELKCWFEQYQAASRITRERLLAHPHLFLKALRASREERALQRLRSGPEGDCEADLRMLETVIRRLRKRLPKLDEAGLPEALMGSLVQLRSTLETFLEDLKRYGNDDRRGDPLGGAHDAGARLLASRDQPGAQALA
jgi:ParB family transcriptional regulator, chromosome partitioning protein